MHICKRRFDHSRVLHFDCPLFADIVTSLTASYSFIDRILGCSDGFAILLFPAKRSVELLSAQRAQVLIPLFVPLTNFQQKKYENST